MSGLERDNVVDKWLFFAVCLYGINAIGWVVFIIWKTIP
jgi:hypothetical protein